MSQLAFVACTCSGNGDAGDVLPQQQPAATTMATTMPIKAQTSLALWFGRAWPSSSPACLPASHVSMPPFRSPSPSRSASDSLCIGSVAGYLCNRRRAKRLAKLIRAQCGLWWGERRSHSTCYSFLCSRPAMETETPFQQFSDK